MTNRHASLTALAIAMCVTGGCSQSAPTTATAPTTTIATAATTAPSPPGTACDRKLVTADQAAAILNAPVESTKTIPGDPQSCEFKTAGFDALTISVRPGHGKAAVGMYTSGKMDEFDKSAPLAGVGDEAVRSLSLERVVARKDDLLCEITSRAMAKEGDDPVAQKLGALCNSIFAKY